MDTLFPWRKQQQQPPSTSAYGSSSGHGDNNNHHSLPHPEEHSQHYNSRQLPPRWASAAAALTHVTSESSRLFGYNDA